MMNQATNTFRQVVMSAATKDSGMIIATPFLVRGN